MPWTLVYCTWFGLSLVVQNYLLCAEKARLASVALACGLVLNVPLNLVLLPRLGLQGAVLSTAAANALSLGLICLFNRRLGFHLDDGAKLVLVLPMLLCLGPWVAAAGAGGRGGRRRLGRSAALARRKAAARRGHGGVRRSGSGWIA